MIHNSYGLSYPLCATRLHLLSPNENTTFSALEDIHSSTGLIYSYVQASEVAEFAEKVMALNLFHIRTYLFVPHLVDLNNATRAGFAHTSVSLSSVWSESHLSSHLCAGCCVEDDLPIGIPISLTGRLQSFGHGPLAVDRVGSL